MPRAKRSDSAAAKAQAFADATTPILPPAHVHLRDCDMPFWNSIVRARAREFWNAADLEIAAVLARCKADIERIQMEIEQEGDVIENFRGTPIANPKHSLLETLTRRAVALSKAVHVHAEATSGKPNTQQKKNQLHKAVSDLVQSEQDDPDSLIPMGGSVQ